MRRSGRAVRGLGLAALFFAGLAFAGLATGGISPLFVSLSHSPEPATVDNVVTLSVGVSNASTDTIFDVTVTDTVPFGFDIQGGSPECFGNFWLYGSTGVPVACSAGTLGGGESRTFTIQAIPRATGTYTNRASATGDSCGDGCTVFSNFASDPITVGVATAPPPPPPPPDPPPPPPPADVTIDVRSDPVGSVQAGTRVIYTITVSNNGPGTARQVAATHAVEGDATFVEVSSDHPPTFARRQSAGCTGGTTATCQFGTLAPGEQAHMTHIVRFNSAGTASSRASVSASEPDPTPANNSDTVSLLVAAAPTRPTQLPDPVPLVSVNVVPTGDVFVIVNGRRTRLTAATQLTFPVTLDTLNGRVALTVALPDGTLQTATFFDGIFVVDQNLESVPARSTKQVRQRAITEVRLQGGNFARTCGPTRRLSSADQRPGRRVRRVWGNGRGNFRTRGRYASATVRGTTWLTQDQCNGTLVRVTVGSVLVNDLPRRRQVVVRAGKSYLARAPR